MKVLAYLNTRGRYDTTLPLAIQSVIMQTVKPDEFIIFDDNDNPEDIRNRQHYLYLLHMLDLSGIKWSVSFGQKKGQHYNHQTANMLPGFDYCWRLDDDTIAEPNVLENLLKVVKENDKVGAVGCSILTPPYAKVTNGSNKIEDIRTKANIQWDIIRKTQEVDHLHCSFLYKPHVTDYETGLSRAAHREESIFTYEIKRAGYKVFITPGITWHLRNQEGGIRNEKVQMFEHDEHIFNNRLKEWGINCKPVKSFVLDNGMGDHIIFKSLLPEIKEKWKDHDIVLYVCYEDVFHDVEGITFKSIGDAINDFGKLDRFNLYAWMDHNKWKTEMRDAMRRMYGIDR